MDSSHWDKVYTVKNEDQVSWFQRTPSKSLELIRALNLSINSPIIDIGGGESRLTEYLHGEGFSDLSVLDISSVCLKKLEEKLGSENQKPEFICSDVTTFRPSRKYRLWHDRATFHFLTSIEGVQAYLEVANEALCNDGFLIVSTFAPSGPNKCSGLPICKYSQEDLKKTFGQYFLNVNCTEESHTSPWGTKQNFVYCVFRKIK